MPQAFTLRVFMPDGDPAGVRLIDRMNWTGLGIVFPRSKWKDIRMREEFERTGVYILTGYGEGDDDRPRVYVVRGAFPGERVVGRVMAGLSEAVPRLRAGCVCE